MFMNSFKIQNKKININMKQFFLIILIILILTLITSTLSMAQCRIMDAKIDWTPSGGLYNGQVSIYLTDTMGIAGIKIKIGSQPDDSDLYQATQTIDGNGHFSSQGSLVD